MARPSLHEQEDHTTGRRRPAPRGRESAEEILDSGSAPRVARQQIQQSQGTKPGTGLQQPVAASRAAAHSMRDSLEVIEDVDISDPL